MNYLKFSNIGEITEESIVLLGASTKRNDENKIGFFGSGNKFALAYLMRNGYEVSIYGGENQIKVSTIPKKIKDQTFDVIVVNGKETSITTEFGAKWELWQSMREIYSNSLDEGSGSIEVVNDIEPKKNETHYYIKIRAELIEWFGNFNNYFAENKEVVFENKYGRILKKHDDKAHLYRKGISVYKTSRNSIYDYDLNNIRITEDRIVEYDWEIGERIWGLIYSCTDKDILKKIFSNSTNENLLENSISSVADISSSDISDECKDVLKSMRLCNVNFGGYLSSEEKLKTTMLPSKVFKSISHLLTDDNLGDAFKVGLDGSMYREFNFTPIQKSTLKKVTGFIKEANVEYLLDYDIIGGLFDDKSIMGYADKKSDRIVITDIGIDKGVNYLLEIIIEEYIHLKHGANDNTRKFQDACIQEMVKIMKIRNAFVL